MKLTPLIALVLFAILPSISSANVISVYEVFDGEEKLIAQKDVSSEWEGYLYYNPCKFNPDIKPIDYPKCESYVQYRNFVNGETTLSTYKHYEFTKSPSGIYRLEQIEHSGATAGFGNLEVHKSDAIEMRINVTSTPMLIKDETYEALKRVQAH